MTPSDARSLWTVLTAAVVVAFAASLIGCASAGPITPVEVSDVKSVAGTWKGTVYQSGFAPDYVTRKGQDRDQRGTPPHRGREGARCRNAVAQPRRRPRHEHRGDTIRQQHRDGKALAQPLANDHAAHRWPHPVGADSILSPPLGIVGGCRGTHWPHNPKVIGSGSQVVSSESVFGAA